MLAAGNTPSPPLYGPRLGLGILPRRNRTDVDLRGLLKEVLKKRLCKYHHSLPRFLPRLGTYPHQVVRLIQDSRGGEKSLALKNSDLKEFSGKSEVHAY